MLLRHHLGDDGQSARLTGFGEQFQPFLLQSLEAVRTGPRLERPAAQTGRAGLLDDVGDLQDLLPALDGTGAGDDAEMAGAHLQAEDLHARRLLLDFGAGHLVRREDWDHFIHPLDGLERLLRPIAFLTESGDHGAFGADDDVTAQPQLLDVFDNLVQLRLFGSGLHNDDHGTLSALSYRPPQRPSQSENRRSVPGHNVTLSMYVCIHAASAQRPGCADR